MDPVRVMIVDDSLTIRAMFEELLTQYIGIEIAGIAASADEALDMVVRNPPPDVITLDIAMPGINGIQMLPMLNALAPKVPVVMVSSSTKFLSDICDDAFRYGAVACFNKSRLIADGDKLVDLLRAASKGKINRADHRDAATTLPTPTMVAERKDTFVRFVGTV